MYGRRPFEARGAVAGDARARARAGRARTWPGPDVHARREVTDYGRAST